MHSDFNSSYFSNVSTQLKQLTISANFHEELKRGSYDFPCCGYICDIQQFHSGIYPIHWHEEFQLTYAAESPLTIRVNSDTITLNPGELIFINSKALHSIMADHDNPCIRHDIIFESNALYGDHKNVYYQKYFSPLKKAVNLPYVVISNDDKDVVKRTAFLRAFDALKDQPFGFEIIVRNSLSEIFILISDEHYEAIHSSQDNQKTREHRMRLMLNYISNHYKENISLRELSASASISERECFRCFEEILDTTPVSFIKYFRVTQAVSLLEDKRLSIDDICFQCGFNTPSYFIKCFKEITGITPLSYRKQYIS